MKEEFCQVLISANNKEEANKITDALLKKRLIAGSLIIKGNAKYWWIADIVEKEYYNISTFSIMKNKDKIINEVKKIHSDKCPIISICKIDGNEEFLEWIINSLGED